MGLRLERGKHKGQICWTYGKAGAKQDTFKQISRPVLLEYQRQKDVSNSGRHFRLYKPGSVESFEVIVFIFQPKVEIGEVENLTF